MIDSPQYLFMQQSGTVHSYFGELCLDIPRPDMTAVVLSEIDSGLVGNVFFQTGAIYKRSSFRARVLSWLLYLVDAAWFAFRINGCPLLFIVAQPPFLPLIGYMQKILFGRKYVVWIDDVYPDVLVRKGVLRENGWITQLWRTFNRKTLGNAEHIFTLAPQMLKAVRQYLTEGFPASIIPTWVDTDVIHPVSKMENVWAREHGLENKFTIMYSGNFGETHDVESLLEAARHLQARSDLRFVLIGAGVKWELVSKSVRERRDNNIIVLPWQPDEVLSESLSTADVSFVSLGKGMEGMSMPSKTYFAMAAGTAILASCTEESDLGVVVKKSNCGLIVRPECFEDIIDAIQILSSNSENINRYKQNARNASVEYYSRTVNVERLRNTLEQITACNAK
jgi:glycosyltransferase involved in cell wall biosynthesis